MEKEERKIRAQTVPKYGYPWYFTKIFSLILVNKWLPIYRALTHATFLMLLQCIITDRPKLAQTWCLLTGDDNLVQKGQE